MAHIPKISNLYGLRIKKKAQEPEAQKPENQSNDPLFQFMNNQGRRGEEEDDPYNLQELSNLDVDYVEQNMTRSANNNNMLPQGLSQNDLEKEAIRSQRAPSLPGDVISPLMQQNIQENNGDTIDHPEQTIQLEPVQSQDNYKVKSRRQKKVTMGEDHITIPAYNFDVDDDSEFKNSKNTTISRDRGHSGSTQQSSNEQTLQLKYQGSTQNQQKRLNNFLLLVTAVVVSILIIFLIIMGTVDGKDCVTSRIYRIKRPILKKQCNDGYTCVTVRNRDRTKAHTQCEILAGYNSYFNSYNEISSKSNDLLSVPALYDNFYTYGIYATNPNKCSGKQLTNMPCKTTIQCKGKMLCVDDGNNYWSCKGTSQCL